MKCHQGLRSSALKPNLPVRKERHEWKPGEKITIKEQFHITKKTLKKSSNIFRGKSKFLIYIVN